MPELSHICDLHHRSQQGQVLNPLSRARDQTGILMDTHLGLLLSPRGNSHVSSYNQKILPGCKQQKQTSERFEGQGENNVPLLA